MTGYRIEPATIERPRPRKPRIEEPKHLDLIRQLPCLVCGTQPVEAAHIRSPCLRLGKRETGMSEKADDKWTLPLCAHDHRLGPFSQHSLGEDEFWKEWRIDPFATALALWASSGDIDTMTTIVQLARPR